MVEFLFGKIRKKYRAIYGIGGLNVSNRKNEII
jgi:hypothetical protein